LLTPSLKGKPGALGRGTKTQVAVTTFLSFWAYIMPIFGAIIADQFTGRFNAICIFTVVVGIGHIILTGQLNIFDVQYMLYSILT
jgi:proton-dependent oligopeptide transporter, POT family